MGAQAGIGSDAGSMAAGLDGDASGPVGSVADRARNPDYQLLARLRGDWRLGYTGACGHIIVRGSKNVFGTTQPGDRAQIEVGSRRVLPT